MALLRVAGILALVAGAAAAPARAQDRRQPTVYLDGAVAVGRVRSAAGTLVEPLHGTVLALAAGVSRWGLVLDGRYAEGSFTSDAAAVPARDLAEGEVQFGVRLLPALTVSAGPHARAYRTAAGTRRWVFWEARVAGQAALIPPLLDAYAQLWGAVAGSTSLSAGFGSERGGEVGARLGLPRTPLRLRIAYRIDRGSGTEPVRSDALEQIIFAVRLGTR